MMVKRYLFVLIIFSIHTAVKAQEVSYTKMDMSLFAKYAMKTESMRFAYNLNLQFLFETYAGDNLNGRDSKKEKEAAAQRLHMLKEKFGSRKAFPDSIASGWHIVLLTDNKEFCKEAKVLVSGNTIQQLVIEDCIRIGCRPIGQIKNARNKITLDINSVYDELEVYFIHDVDSPAIIDEPMQPGYVCFWTSKEKYLNERLMINDIRKDFISKVHEEEPDCLEKGIPHYIMKPGKYRFRATKSGNDKEATFEVKSGMCLRYQLK